MPSRFLHQAVSVILVLIAMLDFAVPCCSAENNFPGTKATISSDLPQAELNIIGAANTPASPTGQYVCDSCYCCSTFTNTSFQLGDPALKAIPCSLALQAQDPPSRSLQSLYRPPRT